MPKRGVRKSLTAVSFTVKKVKELEIKEQKSWTFNLKRSLAVFAVFAMVVSATKPFVTKAASIINIDTINGQSMPVDFVCPSNPLFNPVSISGDGSGTAPPGNATQYAVQVDWGDGVVTNGLGNFDLSQVNQQNDHGPFTFTYDAGPHSYIADGLFTIKVRLYHTQPPGQDNQAEQVASITVCVDADPPANLHLVKNVVGGDLSASDFQLHVKSNGVDVLNSPQAGSGSGTTYTLVAGSYVVSEDTPLPNGYTQTSVICDGQNTDTVNLVSNSEKTCTITNTFNAGPPTGTLTVIKEVDNSEYKYKLTDKGKEICQLLEAENYFKFQF